MMLMRRAGEWMRGIFGRGRAEAESREEFEFHLEMEIQENLRAGMKPDEARRKALADFGGTDWNREKVREESDGVILDDLLRDLRFGFRHLRKRPVFAVASILTLSLGIGMTTTMFTLVDSVILTPLPGSNTEGIVYLGIQDEEHQFEASPTPQLLRMVREHASSFSQVEAYSSEDFSVRVNGEPLRVRGARASAGFFSFLGIGAARGRVFTGMDGESGANPTVVLDHTLWIERFGGSRNVLGQTMRVGDRIHEIIGVLPPEFRVDNRSEILFWIPEGSAGMIPEEGVPVEGALARLSPGVTLEAARAEMDAIVRNNPLDRVASMTIVGSVRTPEELMDTRVIRTILILQVAALLVLLIGCGNLTNLLLAQGETRGRELALRASLGARKGRLMRQLLVENLGLGLLGGAGGILLTSWALDTLPLFLPPGFSGFSVDRTTFFFATGLSVLSVLVVGLLPAWKGSQRSLSETIKGDAPSPVRAFRKVGIREILVTTEVAMTFVLLVAAGLLLKSFAGLSGIDPGFDRENLITVRLELPEDRYEGEESHLVFYEQLRERLNAAIPAQLGSFTITSGLVENLEAMIRPPDQEGGNGEAMVLLTRAVSAEHFRFLDIPILQGRAFDENDGRGGEEIVIINTAAAERAFPGMDPLGRTFQVRDRGYRVVGVSGAVSLPALVTSNLAEYQLFFPFRQSPRGGMTVVARVSGDRGPVIERIREVVRDLDPNLPIMRVALADDLLAESLDRERSNSLLMAFFSLAALVLGVIGIYGVVAYSVSQRIREMGIRLALGASQQTVVRGVVMGWFKVVLAGIGIGAVGAAVLGNNLSRLLHEVDPRDPQVFLLVMAGIAAVALIAAWIPARRAAGSGPLDSLRIE